VAFNVPISKANFLEKANVKLSLGLIKSHSMKKCGGGGNEKKMK
jgi:hypothetical protein